MASCHTHATLPGGALVSSAPTKQTAHILPQNSQNPQKRLSEDILPQNSPNSQKFLAENILPRISQMLTDL